MNKKKPPPASPPLDGSPLRRCPAEGAPLCRPAAPLPSISGGREGRARSRRGIVIITAAHLQSRSGEERRRRSRPPRTAPPLPLPRRIGRRELICGGSRRRPLGWSRHRRVMAHRFPQVGALSSSTRLASAVRDPLPASARPLATPPRPSPRHQRPPLPDLGGEGRELEIREREG